MIERAFKTDMLIEATLLASGASMSKASILIIEPTKSGKSMRVCITLGYGRTIERTLRVKSDKQGQYMQSDVIGKTKIRPL